MTTCYESNEGILTNNSSESYNSRMKSKLGNHGDLPTFVRKLVAEHKNIKFNWLQQDKPKSTQSRRPEDRQRFQKRAEWEAELNLALGAGITDDEIVMRV